MTVTEILKQARALSPQERKELVVMLVETLEVTPTPEEFWGTRTAALLETILER